LEILSHKITFNAAEPSFDFRFITGHLPQIIGFSNTAFIYFIVKEYDHNYEGL
jgi:hypothetical protein